MKLKDRNRTPRGGYYYDDPILDKTIPLDGKTADSFKKLVRSVEVWYRSNNVEIPGNLSELIEDQICMRQPPDRCTYSKKAGDQISRVIHAVAGAVDKLAGTNLQQKARSCRKCGQRRMKLNSR